jgi:hypothetical protein
MQLLLRYLLQNIKHAGCAKILISLSVFLTAITNETLEGGNMKIGMKIGYKHSYKLHSK